MPAREPETDVFIGVGSNIAPERNIPRALALLARRARIVGVSTFYWSAPLGRPEQAPFLNGMLRIATDLPPRELKFEVLRPIEAALGRVRSADKYAPRTIDLDIAVYGSTVLNEPGLHIPDPDICERAFLAIPLHELAPDLVLPGSGTRLADIVENMAAAGMEPAAAFTKTLKARLGV